MADVIVPDFNRDIASMSGVVLAATPGRPSAPRDVFKDILPVIPTSQRSFKATDQVTALFDLYQNAGKGLAPANVSIRVTDDHGAAVITETRTIGIDRFIGAQTQQEQQPANVTGGKKSIPTMGAQTKAVDPNAVAIRAAEFQYAVPLARLVQGRFLLTFEATIGMAVLRRDLQVEIK
jgi:hypothetical protein